MERPSSPAHALADVAAALETTEDDWWLIGGAAVALHGLAIAIADIDVLMSRRDIDRVIGRLGVTPVLGVAVDRIRSEVWARWTEPALVVDLMTGLQVRIGGQWTRLAPATRQAVDVDGRTLYVPSRSELIDILRLFGRPKDLERAEGLALVA